jgi:hypothetical protein
VLSNRGVCLWPESIQEADLFGPRTWGDACRRVAQFVGPARDRTGRVAPEAMDSIVAHAMMLMMVFVAIIQSPESLTVKLYQAKVVSRLISFTSY